MPITKIGVSAPARHQNPTVIHLFHLKISMLPSLEGEREDPEGSKEEKNAPHSGADSLV